MHDTVTYAPTAFPAPLIAVSCYGVGQWYSYLDKSTPEPCVKITLDRATPLPVPMLMVPAYNFGRISPSKFAPIYLVCDNPPSANQPLHSSPLFCALDITPSAFALDIAQQWKTIHDIQPWLVSESFERACEFLNTDTTTFAVPTGDGDPDNDGHVQVCDVWGIAPASWRRLVASQMEHRIFSFIMESIERDHVDMGFRMHKNMLERFLSFVARREQESDEERQQF